MPNLGSASAKSTSSRSHWERALDWLFGRDFFVSYRWSDGRPYAEALVSKLRSQRFDCFLDSDSYLPGDNWKRIGDRELAKTSRLILIGTPEVHRSAPVARELEIFRATGKRIVAIQFGASLTVSEHADSLVLKWLDEDVLRLNESPRAMGLGPSDPVVADVIRTFTGETSAARRLKAIQITAAVLLLLAVSAVVAAIYANDQKRSAEAARNSAQAALTNSFHRTIGTDQHRREWTDIEMESLWELAQLEAGNSVVRSALLDRWFGPAKDPLPALLRNEAGLRAALGGIGSANGNVTEFPGRIVKVVSDPHETDWNRLADLGEGFSRIARVLDRGGAEALVPRVAVQLDRATQPHPAKLYAFARMAETLAVKLEGAERQRLLAASVSALASLLEMHLETNLDARDFDFRVLGGLESVAAKLDAKEAGISVEGVTRQFETHRNPPRTYRLVPIICALASKLESPAQQTVMTRLTSSLLDYVADPNRMRLPGDAFPAYFAMAAHTLDGPHALPLAGRILSSMEKPAQFPSIAATEAADFATPFVDIGKQVSRADAEALAERVVKSIESPPLNCRGSTDDFLRCLVALATGCAGDSKQPLLSRAVRAVLFRREAPSAPPGEVRGRNVSGDVLNALVVQLDAGHAVTLAEELWPELLSGVSALPSEAQPVASVFCILVSKCDRKSGLRILERAQSYLKSSEPTASSRLQVVKVLGSMVSSLDPVQDGAVISQTADLLLEGLGSKQNDLSAAILEPVAVKAGASLARPLADRVMSLLHSPLAKVPGNVGSLMQSLQMLAAKSDDASRQALLLQAAELLLNHMEIPQGSFPGAGVSASAALESTVADIDREGALQLAPRILRQIETPSAGLPGFLEVYAASLSKLAGKLDGAASGPLLLSAAQAIIKKIDRQGRSDAGYLMACARSFSRLMPGFSRPAAAVISDRLLLILSKRGDDPARRMSLAICLAEASTSLEANLTSRVQMFALSHLLTFRLDVAPSAGAPELPDQKFLRTEIQFICSRLSSADLVEALKWPVCTEEGQKMVMGALSGKLSAKEHGNECEYWELERLLPELGMTDLKKPPVRPSVASVRSRFRHLNHHSGK